MEENTAVSERVNIIDKRGLYKVEIPTRKSLKHIGYCNKAANIYNVLPMLFHLYGAIQDEK
jgi:hypothetical protein